MSLGLEGWFGLGKGMTENWSYVNFYISSQSGLRLVQGKQAGK